MQSEMPKKPFQFSLVIDASNPACFTGILDQDNNWLAHKSIEGPALETIFAEVQSVLSEATLSLQAIDRYIYCEGPGSTLGLRLAAMAIKTWHALHHESPPCFTYNSLQLAAHCLRLDEPKLHEAILIADWKKDTWNSVILKKGAVSTCKPILQTDLHEMEEPRYHLPQRKGWQAPPSNAATLNYSPERLDDLIDSHELLRHVDSPLPFASAPANYQKWVPDRHRAPAPDA
jgi:tRNA threonylcarbamoyladenosine biosynthesis protein TsaB